MKTLGLIGGTTWHSTLEYYRAINQGVHARLGGLSSAKLLLWSVNFAELQPPADVDGWARVAATLSDIAQRLEVAGAQGLILCANTPHNVAGEVQRAIGIPLLHIGDAIADAVVAARRPCRTHGDACDEPCSRIATVGLLGTKPTMEQPFLKSRLSARDIASVVPDEETRAYMHASILGELGQGVFTQATKTRYLAIIDGLVRQGAEGVVLACTEIPLLVQASDCSVPVFDTLALHAAAAVEFVLG